MTIDGINISTFGFMRSYVDGHLNLPARKNVLSLPGSQAKDIVFESKEPVITLIGKFDTKADLLAAIEDFYALIKSSVKHDYILTGHNVSFTGVVADGIKPEVYKTMLKLTFKVTITT